MLTFNELNRAGHLEGCVYLCEEGGGGYLGLPGTLPSETALSSPRNNRRHDSHTVPLQLANCLQHDCGVAASNPPPALSFTSVLMVKRGDVDLVCKKRLMVRNNNNHLSSAIRCYSPAEVPHSRK